MQSLLFPMNWYQAAFYSHFINHLILNIWLLYNYFLLIHQLLIVIHQLLVVDDQNPNRFLFG